MIEINSKKASKGNALKELAKKLNIPLADETQEAESVADESNADEGEGEEPLENGNTINIWSIYTFIVLIPYSEKKYFLLGIENSNKKAIEEIKI